MVEVMALGDEEGGDLMRYGVDVNHRLVGNLKRKV
jgi:hypothetical protein